MNIAPEPEVNADQPDPAVESQDGLGVLDDHSQQTDPDAVVASGGQPDAEINPKSRVTAGRHVKHEAGFKSASQRKRHIAQAKKESEKVFHRGAPELNKQGKPATK